MKKTININLGEYPFIINDDVYLKLKSYMTTIEKHFAKSEGVEDIMTDIEVRMAELLTESLGDRKIVTDKDLNSAIEIMGTPEQFGADSDAEFNSENTYSDIKTGKRLFRDVDDKIIGGVCSGLAAYWGFKDPLMFRLITAFLFLFTGVPIIIYIILWIVTPAAENSADKLLMRGEEANVENIGRMIEDEIDDVKDSLNKMKDDYFSKKKDESKNKKHKGISRIISFVINAFVRIFASIINVVLSIFGWKKI